MAQVSSYSIKIDVDGKAAIKAFDSLGNELNKLEGESEGAKGGLESVGKASKKAAKDTSKAGQEISEVVKSLAGFAAGFLAIKGTLALVSGFFGSLAENLNQTANLYRQATLYGLDPGWLAQMTSLAKAAGKEMDDVLDLVRDVRERVGEAFRELEAGNIANTFVVAFGELGKQVEGFNLRESLMRWRTNTEEAVEFVIERLGAAGKEGATLQMTLQEIASAGFEKFGPIISALGTDGVAGALKTIKAMGVGANEELLRMNHEVAFEFGLIGQMGEQLQKSVLAGLLPLLSSLTGKALEFIDKFGPRGSENMQTFARNMSGTILNVLEGMIKALYDVLKAVNDKGVWGAFTSGAANAWETVKGYGKAAILSISAMLVENIGEALAKATGKFGGLFIDEEGTRKAAEDLANKAAAAEKAAAEAASKPIGQGQLKGTLANLKDGMTLIRDVRKEVEAYTGETDKNTEAQGRNAKAQEEVNERRGFSAQYLLELEMAFKEETKAVTASIVVMQAERDALAAAAREGMNQAQALKAIELGTIAANEAEKKRLGLSDDSLKIYRDQQEQIRNLRIETAALREENEIADSIQFSEEKIEFLEYARENALSMVEITRELAVLDETRSLTLQGIGEEQARQLAEQKIGAQQLEQDFKDSLSSIEKSFEKTFDGSHFASAFDSIVDAVLDGTLDIDKAFRNLGLSVAKDFVKSWMSATDDAESIWNKSIKDMASGLVDTLKGAFEGIGSFFTKIFDGGGESLTDSVDGAVDMVKAASGATEEGGGMIDSLIGGFSGVMDMGLGGLMEIGTMLFSIGSMLADVISSLHKPTRGTELRRQISEDLGEDSGFRRAGVEFDPHLSGEIAAGRFTGDPQEYLGTHVFTGGRLGSDKASRRNLNIGIGKESAITTAERRGMGGSEARQIYGATAAIAPFSHDFDPDKAGDLYLVGESAGLLWTEGFSDAVASGNMDPEEAYQKAMEMAREQAEVAGVTLADALGGLNKQFDSYIDYVRQSDAANKHNEAEIMKIGGQEFGDRTAGIIALLGNETGMQASLQVLKSFTKEVNGEIIPAFKEIGPEFERAILEMDFDALSELIGAQFEAGFDLDPELIKAKIAAMTASIETIGPVFTDSIKQGNDTLQTTANILDAVKTQLLDAFGNEVTASMMNATNIAGSFSDAFELIGNMGDFDFTSGGNAEFMVLMDEAIASGKANLEEYAPQIRLAQQHMEEMKRLVEEALAPSPLEEFFLMMEEKVKGIEDAFSSSMKTAFADAIANSETEDEAIDAFTASFNQSLEKATFDAIVNGAMNAAVQGAALAPLLAELEMMTAAAMADGQVSESERAQLAELMKSINTQGAKVTEMMAPIISDAKALSDQNKAIAAEAQEVGRSRTEERMRRRGEPFPEDRQGPFGRRATPSREFASSLDNTAETISSGVANEELASSLSNVAETISSGVANEELASSLVDMVEAINSDSTIEMSPEMASSLGNVAEAISSGVANAEMASKLDKVAETISSGVANAELASSLGNVAETISSGVANAELASSLSNVAEAMDPRGLASSLVDVADAMGSGVATALGAEGDEDLPVAMSQLVETLNEAMIDGASGVTQKAEGMAGIAKEMMSGAAGAISSGVAAGGTSSGDLVSSVDTVTEAISSGVATALGAEGDEDLPIAVSRVVETLNEAMAEGSSGIAQKAEGMAEIAKEMMSEAIAVPGSIDAALREGLADPVGAIENFSEGVKGKLEDGVGAGLSEAFTASGELLSSATDEITSGTLQIGEAFKMGSDEMIGTAEVWSAAYRQVASDMNHVVQVANTANIPTVEDVEREAVGRETGGGRQRTRGMRRGTRAGMGSRGGGEEGTLPSLPIGTGGFSNGGSGGRGGFGGFGSAGGTSGGVSPVEWEEVTESLGSLGLDVGGGMAEALLTYYKPKETQSGTGGGDKWWQWPWKARAGELDGPITRRDWRDMMDTLRERPLNVSVDYDPRGFRFAQSR